MAYSYKKPLPLLFAIIVDCLLLPLYFFRKQAFDLSSCKTILIFSTGGIGDAMLLEPLLRSLQKTLPELAIDIVARTTPSELLKLIPGIRKIILFPEYSEQSYFSIWRIFYKQEINNLKNKYDAAFDAKGDATAILMMLALRIRRRAGYRNGALGALLTKSADAEEAIPKWQQHLKVCGFPLTTAPALKIDSISKQNIAAIHLGAGEAVKRAPLKLWIEQLSAIPKEYSIIALGSEEDKQYLAALPEEWQEKIIDHAGLSLYDEIKLLASAELFIGHDTGLTHIAAALGIPIISLFSLSHNPAIWAPSPAKIITF